MESLRDIFESLDGKLIHKWDHYIEVYETYFEKYRNKEVHLLEIGVSQGGSIELWKRYFGEKLHYYGMDINPRCKELEEDGVQIFIGEQEDKNFLAKIKLNIPKLDILIDDGGHTMIQQIITFEEMYEHLKDDGIYFCEDIHTSYMYAYHGGINKSSTFIEYSKNFIDFIHAWHSENKRKLDINTFTKSTYAIHFYIGIVVLEKRIMAAPKEIRKGKLTVGYVEYRALKKQSLLFKIRWKLNQIFSK